MKESDIPDLIQHDPFMLAALRAVRTLDLPDWWIGAGFVRNKVWDVLHGRDRIPPGDIDVAYFDPGDLSEEREIEFQDRLEKIFPTGRWSVTNQVRMAVPNGDRPYTSTLDGIAHWTETATAVAVTLDDEDRVIFHACFGTADLFGMIVRPTPSFEKQPEKFRARVEAKDWKARWPMVRIEM